MMTKESGNFIVKRPNCSLVQHGHGVPGRMDQGQLQEHRMGTYRVAVGVRIGAKTPSGKKSRSSELRARQTVFFYDR